MSPCTSTHSATLRLASQAQKRSETTHEFPLALTVLSRCAYPDDEKTADSQAVQSFIVGLRDRTLARDMMGMIFCDIQQEGHVEQVECMTAQRAIAVQDREDDDYLSQHRYRSQPWRKMTRRTQPPRSQSRSRSQKKSPTDDVKEEMIERAVQRAVHRSLNSTPTTMTALPSTSDPNNTKQVDTKTTGYSHGNRIRCYTCQQYGHISRKCPRRRQRQPIRQQKNQNRSYQEFSDEELQDLQAMEWIPQTQEGPMRNRRNNRPGNEQVLKAQQRQIDTP